MEEINQGEALSGQQREPMGASIRRELDEEEDNPE